MRLKKTSLFPLAMLSLLLSSAELEAPYVYQKGHWRDAANCATLSVDRHFSLGITAYNGGKMEAAAAQFQIVVESFPKTRYAAEARLLLAWALFSLQEYDLANDRLDDYLKNDSYPIRLEDALQIKCMIADRLAEGARRHCFGWRRLPKWASGRSLAIDIYDEVAAVLPHHELGARALYAKARILYLSGDYSGSIEGFQLLIRRFPSTELAADSYVAISKVYAKRIVSEFHNPDLLSLGRINSRLFTEEFPEDPRQAEIEENLLLMEEHYAQGLYDAACFYQKKGSADGARLYFEAVVRQFPRTQSARSAEQQLDRSTGCL